MMINITSFLKPLIFNVREACNKCRVWAHHKWQIRKQLWMVYKENAIKSVVIFVLFMAFYSLLSSPSLLFNGNQKFIISFLNISFLFLLLIVPLIDLTLEIINTWKQLKSNPETVRDLFLSFMRYNTVILALVLLYILFYRFWESWIGNHIIDSFLSNFESNVLNDIIFILGIIVCLIFAIINWKKRIKWQTIFISTFAIVIWVYYRFNPGPFGLEDSTYFIYLKPLSFSDSFKYFDIVPIFALSKLVPTVPLFFDNRKEMSFKDGFRIEASVDTTEEDSLGRKPFVETAIATMLHTDTSKGSFTFGIDAPWGAGKSSVMRMMKDEISKQCKAEVKSGNKELKKPIVIDFNPWLYAAEKDLSSAFFDELSSQLKRYDDYLADNIIDYSKLVSAFDTPETKFISSLFDLMKHDDNSLQIKKQLISEAIKRIRKRIIIFIDDLDRLDANEILEMMKLIRNTSDFPYMYFIAAYDRTYLINCLKDKLPTKELGFTEKIFQVEYRLPDAPKTEIANKSLRLLKENFNEIGSNDLRFLSDNNHLNSEFLQLFLNLSNIRDVKRLINNFKISKKLSNNTVNPRNLLLMELFKMKYPSAFSFYANLRTQMVAQEEEFKLVIIVSSLKNNKKNLNLNDTDCENITKILSAIYDNNMKPYQIRELENCFLPKETNVSLSDFDALMKNEDINEILYEIRLWLISNKTNSLISRITNYKPTNIKEYHVLLEVLVFLLRTVLSENNYSLITENLKNYFDKYINDSNKQEQYKIIKSIFTKHGNSETCRYLNDLYNHKDSSSLFKKDEYNEIRKDIFLKIMDDSHDFPEIIECYRLCELQEQNDGKKFIPEVQEKMKVFVKKNFKDFIPHILQQHHSSFHSLTTINPIVKDIWGDWIHFRSFLSNLDNENLYFDEFKSFYEEFEINDYKPIKYGFKVIQF